MLYGKHHATIMIFRWTEVTPRPCMKSPCTVQLGWRRQLELHIIAFYNRGDKLSYSGQHYLVCSNYHGLCPTV